MKKLLLATAIMSISGVAMANESASLTAFTEIPATCGVEFDKSAVVFGEHVGMKLNNNTGGAVNITKIDKEQSGPAGFSEKSWELKTLGYGKEGELRTGNHISGEHTVFIHSKVAQNTNSAPGSYEATATISVECADSGPRRRLAISD